MKTRNIFTAISLAGLFTLSLQAQSTSEWTRSYGGNSMEMATTVCNAMDGGYLIGGTSSSDRSGQKSDSSQGVTDYWIVRVDADGQKLWDRTYGGKTFDDLKVITATRDGGYILGGNSSSGISGDKSQPSNGEFDFWVVKINADGDIQWEKAFGGSGTDQLVTIREAVGGGFVIAGSTETSTRSARKTDIDFWVIKTDATGTLIWEKCFGGRGEDFLTSLVVMSDGDLVMAGYSDANHLPGSWVTKDRADCVVIRTDQDGNIRWEKSISGSSEYRLTCMTGTAKGEVILGGCSCQENGRYDFRIVCLDRNGNINWERITGTVFNDKLFSIREDADGGYTLFGNIYSIEDERMRTSLSGSMLKIDEEGNKIWEDLVEVSETEYTQYTQLLQSANGETVIFGEQADSGKYTTDLFLMKLVPGTSNLAQQPETTPEQ